MAFNTDQTAGVGGTGVEMGGAGRGVVVERDCAADVSRFQNDVGAAGGRLAEELGAAARILTWPIVNRGDAGCRVIAEDGDPRHSAVAAAGEAAVVDDGGGGRIGAGGRVVVKDRRAAKSGGTAEVFDHGIGGGAVVPELGEAVGRG